MSSGFENFFEDNFIEVCFDNNFSNLNCILGSIELISSLLIIVLTIIGLIKMIKFYDTFNFEISLLLISIFQIILIDFIIVAPHDFLFEIFFLMQLFIISLIIRKFIKIINDNKLRANILFIIINVINLIIFTLYILSLFEQFLGDVNLYIRFSSRIFYFLITINLFFLSRSLIKKLEKYEIKNEIFDIFLRKSSLKSSIKDEHFIISYNSQELFFLIRKKQITPLYILNFACSLLQLLFILFKNYIFTDDFIKKDRKTLPQNNIGYVIYYIHFLTYFLNIEINYICFYWIIRDQYKDHSDEIKSKNNNKILDDEFIERETIRSSQEVSKDEIFSNSNKKKSICSSSFSDEDDQQKYFVKKEDENVGGIDEIEENKIEQLNINDLKRETINSQNAINNIDTSNIQNI